MRYPVLRSADHELPQRLEAVLEAIYGRFGIGWDDTAGGDQRGGT